LLRVNPRNDERENQADQKKKERLRHCGLDPHSPDKQR
jgi:hypothetical protein